MQKRYSLMPQFRTALTPCVTASGRSAGRAAAVLIGVSVLLLGPGRVQAQPIIDQQNTLGGSVSFGSTGAGQSFAPSLPGISFATFSLSTPSGTTDVLRLDLFDGSGYGGALLASSAPVTVNTGAALQPIELDFSSTISLTPGNTYTLRVALTSGTTYGAEFSPSNPYTGGMGFGSNGVPNPSNDFVFSEGLNVVPEPSALALSTLCGIGLAGSRRVRNLFWSPKRLRAPFLPLMVIGLVLAFASPARAQFINQVLGDNPQGFWLLNDAPGSPTTAVDSSVNGFTGLYGTGVTPQGIAGPSWAPSPGLVANFTGGTISFRNPLNLGANGYTIEAWINPTVSSLIQVSRIVSSGSGFDGYSFGTYNGGGLVFSSFSRQDYFTTDVTLRPNQWQYVGVVLDASNDANFYVNGVLVQTVTGPFQTIAPTTNFTIGDRSPGINHIDEMFMGGLAGISVYDTALTADQIQDQYNAAAVPEPSSLVLTGLAAFGPGRAVWRRRRKASNSVSR
jgi:hypothetical protein